MKATNFSLVNVRVCQSTWRRTTESNAAAATEVATTEEVAATNNHSDLICCLAKYIGWKGSQLSYPTHHDKEGE